MGHWGFVWLAYGVATVALCGYLVLLKGRLRDAGAELAALEQDGGRRTR
ncbi:MAG TPA: heme exporter protein CcmD [Candidatus Methylomirabilis sp.]|nr:heme exporter protein CcmD [Candidatus Methylomirabilis sp.]